MSDLFAHPMDKNHERDIPLDVRKLRERKLTPLVLFLTLLAPACKKEEPSLDEPTMDLAERAPTRQGLLRLSTTTQIVAGRTFSQSQAMALFVDLNRDDIKCQRRIEGMCVSYSCKGRDGQLPNAGPIIIGKGQEAVTLSVRGDGGYTDYQNTRAGIWQPGTLVPIAASGAVVPQFRLDVTIPEGSFALAEPTISALLSLRVSRNSDLQVNWTAASSNVRLWISQDLYASQGRYIECDFDGQSGVGRVPASLLEDLKKTEGGQHAALFVCGPVASQIQGIGEYELDVAAIGGGSAALATID